MFSVPRYDPACHNQKKKEKSSPLPPQARSKKRKLAVVPVIAPDQEALDRKKKNSKQKRLISKATNEALDDLDLFLEQDDNTDNAIMQTEQGDDNDKARGKHGASPTGDNKNRPNNKDDDAYSTLDPEMQAALHVTSLPLHQVAQAWELAPFLRDNLQGDGFTSFFPIQALVIPDVISSERHAYLRARDICITAPTGSGKTLGYALPILNALANTSSGQKRPCRRRLLKALVVLPGRDLAQQVYRVFQHYVKGSHLRVGLAIGQSNFQAEQQALTIIDDGGGRRAVVARQKLRFDPGNLHLARLVAKQDDGDDHLDDEKALSGNSSQGGGAIDILVCTPGRLVDHLDNTPGFSLQHLKFLVVDEADKLLGQSFQNWIDRVLEDANSASVQAWREMETRGVQYRQAKFPEGRDKTSYDICPITWRRGGAAGDTSLQFNTNTSYFHSAAAVCKPVQLRKFLVSATLTKDPQKLATLKLVNPKHFDVHQLMAKGRASASNKFSMAKGLSEYSIECKAEQKPIVLLALLLEILEKSEDDKKTVVVFTSSVDSTHRLARLLQLLWIRGEFGHSQAVTEFSSALNQSERSALMARCRDPNDSVSVLVCSDGMSRGMDLDSVHAVINYDVPTLAKTYVHRCGRTARAGKSGISISILKGGQVVQFRRMRDLIQEPEAVKPWSVKKSLVQGVAATYTECIHILRKVLQEEDDGDIAPTVPLEPEVFDEGGESDQDDQA